MRNLTSNEKFKILFTTPVENIEEVQQQVTGGIVEEDREAGRIVCRVDLRTRIKEWLVENKISQQRMAKLLGLRQENFCKYLNGHIPIGERRIEQILWLMEEGNMVADDDFVAPKIIRQTHQ